MKKEYMDDPEKLAFPASVTKLLEKYPNTSVITIKQILNREDFYEQKAKQSAYPIEGGAIGLVTLAPQEFLLTCRTKPHKGWALPGGRVESGEMFDDALVREVLEECGVSIVIENLLMVENKKFISPRQEILPFWLAVFKATVIPGQNEPYQTEEALREGLQIGVFPLEDLPQEMALQDRDKILKYLGL